MQLYKVEELSAMPTEKILDLYNQLTGKTTKAFRTRAIGIHTFLAAQSTQVTAPAVKPATLAVKPESKPQEVKTAPTATKKKAAKKAANKKAIVKTETARKVINMAETKGRPRVDYKVKLNDGESSLRKESMRTRVIDVLRKAPDSTMQLSRLVSKFEPSETGQVKGAVQKLISVKWIKKVDE